jgi:hypothetical protein
MEEKKVFDQEVLDMDIKTGKLWKQYGNFEDMNNDDAFPIMKRYTRWRPFNFMTVFETEDMPYKMKDITKTYSTWFLYYYIINKIDPKSLFVLPPRDSEAEGFEGYYRLNYISSDNYVINNPTVFVNEFSSVYRETDGNILLVFGVEHSSKKIFLDNLLLVFIYKNLNTIEYYNPFIVEKEYSKKLLDDLSKTLTEIMSVEDGKPVNYRWGVFQEPSPKSVEPILNEFLDFFPFVSKSGYLRTYYESFPFLWNMFIVMMARMEPGYSIQNIIIVTQNFINMPENTKVNFYFQFYLFLQSYSYFLWTIIEKYNPALYNYIIQLENHR